MKFFLYSLMSTLLVHGMQDTELTTFNRDSQSFFECINNTLEICSLRVFFKSSIPQPTSSLYYYALDGALDHYRNQPKIKLEESHNTQQKWYLNYPPLAKVKQFSFVRVLFLHILARFECSYVTAQ